MKVFLVSLIVSFVLWLVVRGLIGSMNLSEKLQVSLGGTYPKRVVVALLIFVVSLIETIISLIVWIVNM